MAEENNNFKTTLESLFKGMDGVVSSKTVVGDAIHIGGTIILPLVDVSFGIGAGAFSGDKKEKGMGGIGGKMTPSAVIVARATKRFRLPRTVRRTSLENAVDMPPRAATSLSPRYHSISAMGLGSGFTVMSVTRPLLKRMRRSAMSARAALCVTMMTVMPSRRQVSCRSCRICLPVT